MNVQSLVRRTPQGVVGASSHGPTGRPGGHSLRSPCGGGATRWTHTADGASTTTLHPWWDGSAGGPTRLGRGADGAGDPPPRREPGERRRQVQDDATDRVLDPHGELEQPLAQRGDL